MLAAFARRTCYSRLLSLRGLATEASQAVSAAPVSDADSSQQKTTEDQAQRQTTAIPPADFRKKPLWWSDPTVDAFVAYKIIKRRFAVHGSQREENYRQLIRRVKTPQEAGWALSVLVDARRHRAALQQHVPFTFHTSQLLITKCVEVRALDVALESLQRAEELGLQFFRAEAYHSVMKTAVINKQFDIATRTFECMKNNGIKPTGKVVHSLIAGSIINGRPELAQQYAEEFRLNNVKINKASQEWLDGVRKVTDTDDAEIGEVEDDAEGPQDSNQDTQQTSAEEEKATATTSA